MESLNFLLNRIKEKLKSVFYLSRSRFLISWFNDYHSFIPILFSKLFFKKSIIIVGGYDAIVDNKNKHGLFFKNGLRSFVAKMNYKMVSEVWVVHKSLENGCDFAKQKFNIISGVRSFTSKKNIVIKEINTGKNTYLPENTFNSTDKTLIVDFENITRQRNETNKASIKKNNNLPIFS